MHTHTNAHAVPSRALTVCVCVCVCVRVRLTVCVRSIQKIPRLLVAAADGYLYLYNLDPQEGGECTLMKQHR